MNRSTEYRKTRLELEKAHRLALAAVASAQALHEALEAIDWSSGEALAELQVITDDVADGVEWAHDQEIQWERREWRERQRRSRAARKAAQVMGADATTAAVGLTVEQKDVWTAALRSGEYAQGRGRLSGEFLGGPRYCCLGVLEKVCGVPRRSSSLLESTVLPQLIQMDLAVLNDGSAEGLWTFPKIADYIDANFESWGQR